MFNFLSYLGPEGRVARARAMRLYQSVMRQARNPVFFRDFDVPDTVDGRFDLVLLHSFVVLNRLVGAGHAGRRTAQAFFDEMFKDVELAVREMGIGDLSVPRHVKRMMRALKGRCAAYQAAMDSHDETKVHEALKRNLFGTVNDVDKFVLVCLSDYLFQSIKMNEKQSIEKLFEGDVLWNNSSLLTRIGGENDDARMVA